MFRFSLVCLALGFGLTAVRADVGVPAKGAARNKIVAWVTQNNKFGPTSGIVKDMSNAVDQEIHRVNNLTLAFGSGLTRSGKAHIVTTWAGEVFTFDLTDAQARKMGVKPSSVDFSTGTKSLDKRQTPAIATVQGLAIDNANNLDGAKPITGVITVVAGQPLPATMAVRLSYMVGKSTVSSFHYPKPGQNGGKIAFSFGKINGNGRAFAGPLVVFVELVTITEQNGNIDATTLSNTVATLVDVK